MIRIEHVAKRYPIRKGTRGAKDLVRGILGRRNTPDHWALRDISLEIAHGDSVALIGVNGCGKSTLLRIISGVTKPTSGSVDVQGTVGGVVDLGAGFSNDLSGLENIFLHGILLGLSREEIRARLDDILEFAELGKFIHSPVRHYSWGMFLRLSFSIAVHTSPDILLVDEALAVGDGYFQWKCMRKIEELKKQGKTLLFVSHVPNLSESICRHAAWIHKGEIRSFGPTSEVVKQYNEFLFGNILRSDPMSFPPEISALVSQVRIGTGEALIQEIRMLDAEGNIRHAFKAGESLTIEVDVRAKRDIRDLALVLLLEKPEQSVTYQISAESGITYSIPEGPSTLRARFPHLYLHQANYELTVALASASDTYKTTFDSHVKMNRFTITEADTDFGYSNRFLYQPAEIAMEPIN